MSQTVLSVYWNDENYRLSHCFFRGCREKYFLIVSSWIKLSGQRRKLFEQQPLKKTDRVWLSLLSVQYSHWSYESNIPWTERALIVYVPSDKTMCLPICWPGSTFRRVLSHASQRLLILEIPSQIIPMLFSCSYDGHRSDNGFIIMNMSNKCSSWP